jgi:hypothetical protein
VKEYGGVETVSGQRQWVQLAKLLGFKAPTGPLLKQSYNRWVHPYDQSVGDVRCLTPPKKLLLIIIFFLFLFRDEIPSKF